jgi:hypothetical protein
LLSSVAILTGERRHRGQRGTFQQFHNTPSSVRLPCHPICVGCALIIPMIIQTIGLDPSGAVWTDEASNLSSLDPSGAIQVDAEHPSRNRKVVGSNSTSGSTNQQLTAHIALQRLALLASMIIK